MPNDELIHALINRNGKLVAPEQQLPPPQPAHVEVPRTHGKDLVNALMTGAVNKGPVDSLASGLGILGAGIPLSILDLLLDQYSPVKKAQDVNLPSSGPIDPRILKAQGFDK